jgi:CheY-like chemotaxis protein
LILWEWPSYSESVAQKASDFILRYSFLIFIRDAISVRGDGDAMVQSPRQGRIALSKPSLVAIIDDDESVRATTGSLVRSVGYIVHAFASAEDFLRSGCLDAFSCVVADVQMSGMSGVQLQDHLRSQGYRVPFIFFTAFPDEKSRAKALAAGALCYLTKPFDADNFVQYLRSASNIHDGGAGN